MNFTIFLALLLMRIAAALPKGFSYLHQVDPSIIIQPRYFTAGNFRGQPVRGYNKPVIIFSSQGSYALKAAQAAVRELGYSLVVYDAYRPQKSVDDLVSWVGQPETGATKQQFYPYLTKNDLIPDFLAPRSGHTRGSRVDLTLIRLGQQPYPVRLLDYKLKDGRVIKYRDDGTLFMGGHFDLFDLASYHDTYLVDEQATKNRNLLRSVMEAHGFDYLPEEWWHYSLKNQPFPQTYFDFDVE